MNKLAVGALVFGSVLSMYGAQESHGPFTYGDTGNAPPLPSDPNPFFTVPLFNPLGGTRVLTGVRYDLHASLTEASVLYENTQARPNTVDWTYLFVAAAFVPVDGTPLVLSQTTYSRFEALEAFDGDLDGLGPSGRTYAFLEFDDSQGGELTPADGAAFSQFIGVGTIQVPYLIRGGHSAIWNDQDGFFLSSGFKGLELSVIYDYEGVPGAIPETSTVISAAGLVGLGLLGYLRHARRRS